MLTDTGPIVAIIDKRDIHHKICTDFLKTLRSPMITTWPCLTEAAHLLRSVGGWTYVLDLWRLREVGALRIHHPCEMELNRIRVLMEKYQDTPCDLADASIVATAVALGVRKIFTRDSHYYAFLLEDKFAFKVLP